MLQNNILVLPTSRAIRHYINSKKTKNQFLPKLIPIGDFFQLSIKDTQNREPIDKALKIIYLKEAIKNVDITKLGLSSDFNSFFKQSDYIFRFFNEMAMEYIEFDTLLDMDTYTLYSDHIELLKLIYKNYVELLDKNNFIDNILLPKSYKINSDFIEQYDTITIYIEGYLSSFEYNIIKDISKIVKCELKLTLNRYNQKNKKLFPTLEDQLDIDHNYTIDLTNQKVLEKTKIEPYKKEITITPIPSQIEQIAFVKYQVTKMVQSGLDPSSIVVITPNEKVVKMMQLFDSENYFNFAMGLSIENSKIVQVLQLVSKIIVDKEPKDEKKFEFLEIDEDSFNRLFKNIWTKSITKEIFEDIMNYIFSLESSAEILEQLEQIKLSLDILLFKNMADSFEKLLVKDFIKIVQTDISKITIDDVRGGKITVMGILETRLVEFDGVIIIDFNDDKIPKISVKDKFLSSKLKQKVGLPTITDRENLQRYYYQRVFDRSQALAIGYIDDDISVMSRFIVELFPNYKQYLKKDDFKSIIYKQREITHFYKDIVEDIDLSTLEWSATSLKEYLSCKRKFYYHYIAKIKDHTISIKPQAYEIGTIIHDALEYVVKENDFNIEAINNYITKFEKNNPYLILELELWKKKLERVMNYEKIRKQNGIVIFDVEKEFRVNYNGVILKGKIDRIDKYPDNSYEILDYKTSSSLKIDTAKNYEDSKDFQLEFYYLASRDKMIKNVAYYMLNDATIQSEVMLKEKLEILDIHLKALKTTKVDFKMCEDISNCQFCSYSVICNREI